MKIAELQDFMEAGKRYLVYVVENGECIAMPLLDDHILITETSEKQLSNNPFSSVKADL